MLNNSLDGFLPFLAVLCDEDIYTPDTIVRYGRKCGLFDFYLALSPDRHLDLKIRRKLTRLADEHAFPKQGDGLLTRGSHGSAVGYAGRRWKLACKLAPEHLAEPLGKIKLKKYKAGSFGLLDQRSLFVLAEIEDDLRIKAKTFIDAATVVQEGGSSTWQLMGLVPVIGNQWLVYMPIFSILYQNCSKNLSKDASAWTTKGLLEQIGIFRLTDFEKMFPDLQTDKIERMAVSERKDAGIWYATSLGFVIQRDILAKMVVPREWHASEILNYGGLVFLGDIAQRLGVETSVVIAKAREIEADGQAMRERLGLRKVLNRWAAYMPRFRQFYLKHFFRNEQ